MEIPTNNTTDSRIEEIVNRVIKTLQHENEYREYRNHYCTPIAIAMQVCKMFVDKGYHAKFNHFTDGRAPYQCFVISKTYCQDVSARAVYSEIIG